MAPAVMRSPLLPIGLSTLISLSLGAACDNGGPRAIGVPAPAAKVPEAAPTPEEAVPEREPQPKPFADQLGALGASADAIPKAVDLFISHHGERELDEATTREGSDALLAFIETRRESAYKLLEQPAIFSAACERSGQCGGEVEVTAEHLAALDVIESRGVAFEYQGEGDFRVVPAYAKLGERLGRVISPTAKLYLDALAWDSIEVSSQYDEHGFEGEPDDVATLVLRWEALANAGIDAYSNSDGLAQRDVERYLRLCWSGLDEPPCVITPKMQDSYRGFIAEHGSSRYRAVVQHFITEAKVMKFTLDGEQLDALITDAMAKQP